MKRLAKTTASVCAAVVGCGAAAGMALTIGSEDVGQIASARTASSAAKTVPSGLSAAYRFLTSGSSTVMPTKLGSNVVGLPGGYGVNPSLGRRAGSIGTERLWLVPGRTGSCLLLGSGSSGCGPNAFVERQGVWIMLVPVSGAAPTVYGIVPDGATVSDNSATTRMSRSGRAFMVAPRSKAPGRFTIHTASGATINMTVPAPTGHPQ
jgi:hypothetical protein